MADEKEEKMTIPMLNVTDEDLERDKKSLQNAKEILTPPEGQVLAGVRAFCPIHGDITRASKIIKHTIFMKEESTGNVRPVAYSDVVCLACLSKLWREQVVAKYPKDADGEPGNIKIAPVFISKEEYEKIVKEQEEKAQKMENPEEETSEEKKE